MDAIAVSAKAVVLVVDDEPAGLALMGGLLENYYTVKVATDGETALGIAAAEHPPDLILLDIMMPGMDGYEVCRRLKEDPKTRDIPVIFLTAKAKTEDEKNGLELGVVEYITKPISAPIVLARIKTHLALKAAVDLLRNESILIVDDKAANVSLLERLLRDAGYARVASTMDPREVCALHSANRYDLILLDLQMPGMDGFQVMEDLKTYDAEGDLSILVITAQPDRKLRALRAGAKDFISKPFDLVEVKARIHNLLETGLLHKKLKDYNKRLKRFDRMKGEFVPTVSHELTKLLTSIRGSLVVLASDVTRSQPDKLCSFIENAQNDCERLIRLINDTLDIESIESGQVSFALRPLDLMEMIEQAVKADEGLAAAHNVRLQVVAAQPGATVNADPDRFAQVMTNLISNACKFSAPGNTVDIAVARAGGRLKVAVSNCGPGIADEFIADLFQQFSRAESSEVSPKGGAGLSIAKAIVERLGGEIGFTSAKEQATTFYFFLPECPESAAARLP